MNKLDYLANMRKYIYIYTIIVLLIGICLRVYEFGVTPSGLNQDEAFAGYEAFSLLNYGIDSAGYRNPTYFVSWGSGMNVLESYLAIPFVWLFGNTTIAIRMPMLICSILSLPVFYLLVKEFYGRRAALFAMGLLAVCPWHVMLSRWGLESNLAPAFLMFGFYFLVKGLNNNRYWPFAALMYGVSLYSYAITWIVVPLTLLGIFLFLLLAKYEFSLKYLFISIGILFFLALPHMLFLLINMNVIPEIRTALFSIPKLVAMRGSEVSLNNALSVDNLVRVFRLVIGHGDDMRWNTFKGFNMYYSVSIPFLVVGFVKMLRTGLQQIKKHEINAESFLLIGILCSLFVILLIAPINVNKANHIHLYMIILITLGLREIIHFLRKKPTFIALIIVLYAFSAWNFAASYFGTYNEVISADFRDGVRECIEYVNEKGFERINVDDSVYYPQVLYFDRTPTPEYIDTRVYTNYPSAFLNIESFTKYTFGVVYESIGDYDAYIVPSWNISEFSEGRFNVETFGNYSVVYA